MKKSTGIQLILITAALASCNREWIPRKSVNVDPADSSLTAAPGSIPISILMAIPWIPATARILIRSYGIILSIHSGFFISGRLAPSIILLPAAYLGRGCSGGAVLLSFGEGWGKAPFPGAPEPGYYHGRFERSFYATG